MKIVTRTEKQSYKFIFYKEGEMNMLLEIDGDILLWIQESVRSEWMTPFWKGISWLGNSGMIWLAISFILLLIPKTRKVGIMSIVALGLSGLFINCIIKNLVARPRPFTQIEGLTYLINKPRDYSFPSGHTSASFAAAVVFLKKMPKKFGILFTILAALIAFSRLYLGVHYPTDVLAGAILGTLIAFLAMWIYNLVEKKDVDKLQNFDSK